MFEEFDVVQTPSGDYELINGHSVINVEFNVEDEKLIFESLLTLRDKSTKNIVKTLIKDYGKEKVYSFFLKFKTASIIFFDSEDALAEGNIFSAKASNDFKVEEAAQKSIIIISASSFPNILRQFSIFKNAEVFDASKMLDSNELDAVFSQSEMVIVDAFSANPQLMEEINSVALANNKPWLLVQGVYEQAGHVGPLFYGNETGCYQCFRDRLRSNMQNLESYDRYENWLREGNQFSKSGLMLSDSFGFHIASIVASEIEKFFLEYDVPQSYGFLLEVNALNYNVNAHRLYKVPFCSSCNTDFEYRRAPWLDPVTLGEAS